MDFTVFLALTPLQKALYKSLCDDYNARVGREEKLEPLPLITNLKKLCNTPELVYAKLHKKEENQDEQQEDKSIKKLAKIFEEHETNGVEVKYSAKLQFLSNLLDNIRTTTKDKVAIVSNFTETLQVLANLKRISLFSIGWINYSQEETKIG